MQSKSGLGDTMYNDLTAREMLICQKGIIGASVLFTKAIQNVW